MKEDHSSAAEVTAANLLDAIVRLSEFDVSVRVERATALIDGGPGMRSSVETKSLGRLSDKQLRKVYESNGWRTGEWGEGLDIRPKPKGEAARFRLELAELLNAYAVRIDDCPGPDQDCIGHVLGDVMGAWSSTGRVAQDGRLDSREDVSSVSEFCDYLFIASAIRGPEEVAGYLTDWLAGEPLRYTTECLLTGLSIDAPLALSDGLRVTALPEASLELPFHLPGSGREPVRTYLGGIVLSVDCEVQPALFKPESRDGARFHHKEDQVHHTWALEGSSLDRFCQSLSVACSRFVRFSQVWCHYPGLVATRRPGRYTLPAQMFPRVARLTLTQDQLALARRIDRKRQEGLDIAISRWVKSKRPDATEEDSWIDLRIAMEALFGGHGQGEVNYRIAIQGAAYLGGEAATRRRNCETLREAYHLASRAIHPNKSGKSKSKSRSRAAVEASRLCREAILKRVNDGAAEPDWIKLVLAADEE